MKKFRANILVVDDEEMVRNSVGMLVGSLLGKERVAIHLADSVPAAIKILNDQQIHVILLDNNLGITDQGVPLKGLDNIPAFLAIQPELQIIMVTGDDEPESFVRAFKLGAFDYFVKDHPDDLLVSKIRIAIELAELRALQAFTESNQSESEPIWPQGVSIAWRRLIQQAQQYSKTSAPILLLGKSGTGKSTLAGSIAKARGSRTFIDINVAAIPRELIEAELFGYEAGAFTGATKRTPGYFEKANNGTLFLDEIGDLSMDLQVKILKVLDKKSFNRLGNSPVVHSNFDLICATHRDLEKMVEAETFRKDLYHRLAALTLEVPSLKDRKSDIPGLIQSLLVPVSDAVKYKVSLEDLPADFVNYMIDTPHQGEVRGLYHLLLRTCAIIPSDRQGKKDFKKWRRYVDPAAKEPLSTTRHGVTSKNGILIQLDLTAKGFPGIQAALEEMSEQVYLEATRIYKSDVKQIAKVLKVGQTSVYKGIGNLKKIEPK